MIDTMLEAIKVADPNKQRRQKNGDKGSGFGLCIQLCELLEDFCLG